MGWLVLPFAAIVAAAIFGQVTVNETMTARYISPALRTRMYSVRFFVGFIGAAAAAPMVASLHERTGSLATATLVMAALAIVTFLCALAFPDRREDCDPSFGALLQPRRNRPRIFAGCDAVPAFPSSIGRSAIAQNCLKALLLSSCTGPPGPAEMLSIRSAVTLAPGIPGYLLLASRSS